MNLLCSFESPIIMMSASGSYNFKVQQPKSGVPTPRSSTELNHNNEIRSLHFGSGMNSSQNIGSRFAVEERHGNQYGKHVIENESDKPKEQASGEFSITSSTNQSLKFGQSPSEKVYCFVGNVERMIKWKKILKEHSCFYEVIASVVSIQEGNFALQKIMLLRDNKGPILQVIHYLSNYIQLSDFSVGQKLSFGSPLAFEEQIMKKEQKLDTKFPNIGWIE